MQLYVNGQPAPSEIVRNHLYKSPENGGSGLDFGARMRSPGLKGASLDELRIYDRPLAPIDSAQLFVGHSLDDAIAANKCRCLATARFYLAAIFDTATSPRPATARFPLRCQIVSTKRAIPSRKPA